MGEDDEGERRERNDVEWGMILGVCMCVSKEGF